MRISKNGKILHANNASAPLLLMWGVQLDQKLPDRWLRIVASVIDSDEDRVAEVICDDRVFSLEFVPILEEGYVNVYGRDITARKQMDRELRERRHQLRERVKELNCLYGISGLVITPGITLEAILQGSVDLIPPSWQYPEIACARITIEDQEYQTENFREGFWKQSADILIDSEISGLIEVHYLEETLPHSVASQSGSSLESKKPFQEEPFLKEERNLINAIAERLGRIIERSRVEERVHRNEMLLAALEERERIGRELHDDLGQVMGYVSAQVQAALVRIGEGEVEEANAILDQLSNVAQDASDEVRGYILGIRSPSTKPEATFFAALARYREVLQDRYGLQTRMSLPDGWRESPFAPEVESQLLHIIREALTNVRRHAGVTSARLIFTEYADEVQVIIEDDGCGFNPHSVEGSTADPDPDRGADQHFGLAIMRERVAAASGRLEVRSAPGEGTRVIVYLPRAISQSVKPSKEAERGVRVLLVDDHPLYLEGLRNLLAARGMQVVGQAHDGLEAQRLARELRPDLILMDMYMPRCDGLEATRIIKAELPQVKIVMLTLAADEKILFDALKSGASGYLLKSLDRTQFFTLLGEVLEGETVLSPGLASRVLSEMVESETGPIPEVAEEPLLTARQIEVLEQIAQGKTNKEIAASLHISERTVKYHVGQILERLQLKSRYELSHYVRRQGSLFKSED